MLRFWATKTRYFVSEAHKTEPVFSLQEGDLFGINPGACVNCGHLHCMCLALVCLSLPTTEAPIYGPIDSKKTS